MLQSLLWIITHGIFFGTCQNHGTRYAKKSFLMFKAAVLQGSRVQSGSPNCCTYFLAPLLRHEP